MFFTNFGFRILKTKENCPFSILVVPLATKKETSIRADETDVELSDGE